MDAADTMAAGARRAYGALPSSARRRVTNGLGRIRGRRLARENTELLNTADLAVGGFEGKRVLEVGSEATGALLRDICAKYGAAEAIGVNPLFRAQTIGPRSRLEQVDARDMEFADSSFDVVVSVSAFEHIHRLDEVVAECHRVLRPGGVMYSHFGPIWSTPYGHHLWLTEGARTLTYANVILPPWCHLLRSRDELLELCADEHGMALAERIVDYILDSDDQNQLFFDDYEQIITSSEFESVFLKGYDVPALMSLYPEAQKLELLDELNARFPHRTGFLYDGIVMLVRKSAD
ncbi:methyltransferase domain-containing protein [Polaromonas sp.]|uniref:methyltransferase domain-containing protein n=1 Tax=Polaromonas sp. TaxID=1869339 RepID=UPI0035612F4C